MKYTPHTACCLLGLALCLQAALFAAPTAQLSTFTLEDGDCLVFCGDSITHQCLYTQYLEDFFFTRFPDRQVHLINAGVSGDRAADALLRFKEDVATHQPKVVTLLLGMNDGRYQQFDHEILARFEQDMSYLTDRIAELGAIAILMGPTMYDSRTSKSSPPSWITSNPEQVRQVTRYYNPLLAFYGAWLRDRASDRGLGYVGLHTVMNDLTDQARITDPDYSMVPDAVHPNAEGHAVIAAAFVDQMNLGIDISTILFERLPDQTWQIQSTNGTLEEFTASEQEIRFSHQANALPWALPEEARRGLALYGASERLGTERIQVVGLHSGTYQLSIEGVAVLTCTSVELAAGIELHTNEETPQYQQALEVADINKERNDKAIRPIRDNWLNLRAQRNHPDTPESASEFARWKASFDAQTAELTKQSQIYLDRIYAINRPKMLHYTLTRIVGRSTDR